MNPYWESPFLKMFHGDCREVLASMAAESVHMVVTSPPYW
jgi:DNA modification methylase